MILKNNKEYYPLEFGKLIKNGKTYYNRSSRQKSYFYLDLRTSNLRQQPAANNEGD